ncbi:MAG: hypothetical protein LIP06_05625 [Tannerellaceae bacterium]|nr:hypothetical protein [Tannerellaceae bacterium]
MKEELTSKYIANSVIIITADYLGQEVSCLDIAKKVWETKAMPEPVMLGTYSNAAQDAIDKILSAGLGEKADSLGELFYHTGQFLVPIEVHQAIEEIKKDFPTVTGGILAREKFSVAILNVSDLGWWQSTSFKPDDDIEFKTNRVLSNIQEIRTEYARRNKTEVAIEHTDQ